MSVLGLNDPRFDFKASYGPEDERLRGFFVPALERSVRYDRTTGYFTSSALVSVARGLVGFLRNGGRMRLLAGAQLSGADADALDHGTPLEDVLVQRLMADSDDGASLIAQRRLEVLAWMVREGRLEVRIAVRLDERGRPITGSAATPYFHKKSAVLHDADGNRVALVGSNNESAMGWDETGNAEEFHVFRSWRNEAWRDHGQEIEERFEREWAGELKHWLVVPLPEAVRQRLIKHVTYAGEPPYRTEDELERDEPPPPAGLSAHERADAERRLRELLEAPRRDGGTGVGIVTAPVKPWPHQRRIAHRVTNTYPRSYLFADEVGMGKTIEAGLVFRELLLSGKAERILILVPASVIKQWQEELLEKFLLRIPRYDGGAYYYRDGGEDQPATPDTLGGNPWNAFPVMLATSHLARTRRRRQQVLDAGPWDVVFVDEAHHARRRGSKSDATPNALLNLLQAMKNNNAWSALYLASATPMQMHAHEAWDLLQLLGLTERWGESADTFTTYYEQLRSEGHRDWTFLQAMLADHLSDPANRAPASIENHIRTHAPSPLRAKRILEFHTKPSVRTMTSSLDTNERDLLDLWLRENTPMRRRVFRTTRTTLHEYKRTGLLDPDTVIPERLVASRFIDMNPDEADLYARIEDYIGRYYNRYKSAGGAQRALGFIMTVYRRRLTSSFQAITRSLHKRRITLTNDDATLDMLLDDDDIAAADTLFEPDELEGIKAQLSQELDELDAFLTDLERLPPDESKMLYLLDDLQEAFLNGHRTAIVFTQYGDTLDYLADKLTGTFGSAVATWSGAGGTRWNATTKTWDKIPKPALKDLFRAGNDIRILIGTDSMSEGLNLQTCGYLVNYDMPWNFMRVEQRIGRIDRIGGQPHVHIRNYFYRDTVEQRIHDGLAEDIDWFQNVVGPTRPILGQLEAIIEDAAMRQDPTERDTAIDQAIDRVRQDLEAAHNQPVKLDDATLNANDHDEPTPVITLDDLRTELLNNPLTQPHLTPIADQPAVLAISTHHHQLHATFDRNVADATHTTLLTYGTSELQYLINAALEHDSTP